MRMAVGATTARCGLSVVRPDLGDNPPTGGVKPLGERLVARRWPPADSMCLKLARDGPRGGVARVSSPADMLCCRRS